MDHAELNMEKKSSSLKEINRYLHSKGLPDDSFLVKGPGYFYFAGEEPSRWASTSEMVLRCNELTLDEWHRSYLDKRREYSTAALVEAGKFMDFIDNAKGLSVKAKDKAKQELTDHIEGIAKSLKITAAHVELAFKEPQPQNMLKACSYSVALMYGAFQEASRMADNGVMSALVHIAGVRTMSNVGQKIKDKSGSVDNIIKKYPVLKALTGPAIAGLMLYGYTTCNTNNLGDWDLAKVAKAFKGDVSVEDFVQSGEAHSLGTYLAEGNGMSLSALAASSISLGIGLVATAVNNSDSPKLKEIASSIRTKVNSILPAKKASEQIKDSDKDGAKPNSDKAEIKSPDKGKAPSWWKSKSKDSQENYLKEHPDSMLTPAYKIAMNTMKTASLEEALIKDASNYSYFKLKRVLNISRRGKDWQFPAGSKLGWRMSSNGKSIRIISPEHGTGIIFSLAATLEVMKWLGKNDPKAKK